MAHMTDPPQDFKRIAHAPGMSVVVSDMPEMQCILKS